MKIQLHVGMKADLSFNEEQLCCENVLEFKFKMTHWALYFVCHHGVEDYFERCGKLSNPKVHC